MKKFSAALAFLAFTVISAACFEGCKSTQTKKDGKMNGQKKYLALSFDDGPSYDSTMNDMLDVLEKHNVKASFYLIGNKIAPGNVKVIKRAQDLGCDIQNHSWTHSYMERDFTVEQINQEIDNTNKAIEKVTGKKPEYFRPPYIDVGSKLFGAVDMAFICGKGCEDWLPEHDVQYRLDHMTADAEDGLIYLLHVAERNKLTVQAVDQFIPKMQEAGYTFVTVPELFKIKGINPKQKGVIWTVVNESYGK